MTPLEERSSIQPALNKERSHVNMNILGPPSLYRKSRMAETVHTRKDENNLIKITLPEDSREEMSTIYSLSETTNHGNPPNRDQENGENASE